MENDFIFILGTIITLSILCGIIVQRKVDQMQKDINYYLDRASKFESAYFQLLASDVVDRENYEIRLPWLPVGEDDCIRKRGGSNECNY